MDHLHRFLAPLGDAAWRQVEDEARTRLTTLLAARQLVDFAGPHGWAYSATPLGRTAPLAGPADGVLARQRQVLPVVELRAELRLSRDELDDAERGADDLDLGPLEEAARRLAVAENVAVFHGYPAGGLQGITEASTHPTLPLGDVGGYPTVVARAVDALLAAGIEGPYGLAIAPGGHTAIVETTEHGGYPLLEHLRHILGGPVVWAPGVRGAVVLSLRGGDFMLDVGQDLSVGYRHHDAESVWLYLEESFTFRVLEPDAAVALV